MQFAKSVIIASFAERCVGSEFLDVRERSLSKEVVAEKAYFVLCLLLNFGRFARAAIWLGFLAISELLAGHHFE